VPTCPPDNLVDPAELAQYNVPSGFLAQFVPRGFEVQISTAGALGTMAFVWRRRGEDGWSNTPIISSPSSSPWSYALDDVFANLTFAVGSFVASTVYVVDESGTVTSGDGHLSVTRYDLRSNACEAVTREALLLMKNAVTPPLTAWTKDAKTHAANWVYAILKRGKGATANNAGAGDELIWEGEKLARGYFLHVGETGRPDGWVDGSVSSDGPLFSAYPIGDDDRNWREAW
jgi:hypothetical protein